MGRQLTFAVCRQVELDDGLLISKKILNLGSSGQVIGKIGMSLNLNKEDISILNSEIFNTVYETLDNGKSIYGIDYVDG